MEHEHELIDMWVLQFETLPKTFRESCSVCWIGKTHHLGVLNMEK
jgi:hypothetical protein